jgi:hypothetical protein
MEERSRGQAWTDPATRAVKWTRSVLPGTPPVPRPRSPRVEPLRRSWLVAGWQARLAVQAGISLDDFLRARLARYLGALHVPRGQLPLAVEVQDGQVRVGPAPSPDAAPIASGPDAWLAPLAALDGPAVRDEVARLEVRAGTLEGEIEAARRRAGELGRRLAADVAAGIVAGPTGVEATAEQLGRPPVRGGASTTLAATLGAAAVAAETWQIAQPLLRGAGLDPTRLGAEAARAPADATFAAIFALGVAVALTALAHAALEAAGAALGGDPADPRRRWNLGIALCAPAVAAALAAAVTALPARGQGAGRAPLVVLLVAVSFAAALALRAAARDAARRREDLAAALTWDRERARALAERSRRLEEVDWAEDDARTLERERDAARRRLEALSARAAAAGRVAEENARRERAAMAHLAENLVSALELDRYDFVRQASARGADDLVAPRRRKVAEPPPAAAAEPAPAGRMAS